MKYCKRLLFLKDLIYIDNYSNCIKRFNEIDIRCLEALGKLKAYFGKRINSNVSRLQFEVCVEFRQKYTEQENIISEYLSNYLIEIDLIDKKILTLG